MALRTHTGGALSVGLGLTLSTTGPSGAFTMICRPVTCRGRAPAGRKECDLIAPLCQVAGFWRVRLASARRVR